MFTVITIILSMFRIFEASCGFLRTLTRWRRNGMKRQREKCFSELQNQGEDSFKRLICKRKDFCHFILLSRTKTDDPEKEKMKAKAKEIQRIEQETIRHQEANRTALEAIGGPKKRKFGEVGGGGGGGVGGGGGAGASGSSNVPVRARTKRVHLRDVMFLMEQEKDLKHSNLLFKSYCS